MLEMCENQIVRAYMSNGILQTPVAFLAANKGEKIEMQVEYRNRSIRKNEKNEYFVLIPSDRIG